MLIPSLWGQVEQATMRAQRSGALETLPTEHLFVEDGGIRFVVRIAPARALRDKDASSEQAYQDPRTHNPFLPPYDPDLFVAELSPTHVCLLNKYNVFDNHILIVTHAYESQEAWLTRADFHALWLCMREIDGLAFYNGGPTAGASQPHKHLQLVPFPLAPNGPALPVAPLLEAAQVQGQYAIAPGFPFVHAVAKLDISRAMDAQDAASYLFQTYCCLLHAVHLIPGHNLSRGKQSAPYNLLATHEWMWLVPRSAHKFQGIQINALGYAGALLVRDRAHVAIIQTETPRQMLAAAATYYSVN